MLVGAAIWGGCNWGGGGVYINHHSYNNFNRSNIGGDSNWRHNVDHRKGVAYRDQATAQQYNRDFSRDAQSREQFRGRGEGGRQATHAATPRATRRLGRRTRSRRILARRPVGGTMDRGGASRDFSGGRSSGFEGVGNGPPRATSAAVAMRVGRAWARGASRAGVEAAAAAAEVGDETDRMAQASDRGSRRTDPACVSVSDRLARRNGGEPAQTLLVARGCCRRHGRCASQRPAQRASRRSSARDRGDWLLSGDEVADRAAAERFVAAYDAKHRIRREGASRAV